MGILVAWLMIILPLAAILAVGLRVYDTLEEKHVERKRRERETRGRVSIPGD